MARHYSTREFFRQMPKALLARYFQRRGVLVDFDFAGMRESKIEPLFEAWLGLPDDARKGMDAEFRDIFELSDKGGFKAILEEAHWQLRDDPVEQAAFVEKLAGLGGHYERAMVTFLEHPRCWGGALRFHYADGLTYWRKRKNLPHVAAAVDKDSLLALKLAIAGYFHTVEGRGKNCLVEPLRRGELDYFFAYPEDYSLQSKEWVDGDFDHRPHNPAFDVVFVYSQKDGTLDLNFRGKPEAVEALQDMFARIILKLDQLPPDPKDKRVYDLAPLQRRDFQFVRAPGSGIEHVAVKRLRLSSRVKWGDRITLEANTSQDPGAVYTLYDRLAQPLELHLYDVTQVELAVTVQGDGRKPHRVVKVCLTQPNSCSLKYDELDLKLRAMLAASGLEPRLPALSPEAEPGAGVPAA